jgi:hypothetical protein
MGFSQLFPLKDATLYSDNPLQNTGLDEIIEFTKPNNENAARILIQFDQAEINNVVTNNILPTITGSGVWKSYLRVYASQVESLPTQVTILCEPVSEEWDQGTGKSYILPTTTDGASWTGPKTGSLWVTSSNSTSSFLSGSTGGGSWYTGSTVTQTINQYTNQDLYLDVTSIVDKWTSASLDNNGFILRVTESVENNPNYVYHLSYFSRDTNTIYPPSLMFYWDSQDYNPNTSSLIATEVFDISLENNSGIFQAGEDVLFRVYARETYPARTFVTQSLYTYNKTLPSSSWYQIVDVDTNEIIVPFNDFTLPGFHIFRGPRKSAFSENTFHIDGSIYRFYPKDINYKETTYSFSSLIHSTPKAHLEYEDDKQVNSSFEYKEGSLNIWSSYVPHKIGTCDIEENQYRITYQGHVFKYKGNNYMYF